jgi:hypothetical protein
MHASYDSRQYDSIAECQTVIVRAGNGKLGLGGSNDMNNLVHARMSTS